MSAAKHKMFAAISKVDDNGDGTIDVHGIASTESRDAQGECVTKNCMAEAIPEYLMHGGTGPLRAMHQPIAAGYVYKAEVNANGDTEISAKVVDPVEVLKVTSGVYKGFSIGGKKVPGGYDTATKTINKMKLTEISLVDRPANPEATITMWKGEDMEGSEQEHVTEVSVTEDAAASVDALAAIINKGAITPQRLVELAEVEIAKAAVPAITEPVIEVVKVNEPAVVETIPEVEVKKGMYGVQEFAGILRNISYLVSDSSNEAANEGDNSIIPALLNDWLKEGAMLFQAMAQEEVSELMEQLNKLVPVPVVPTPVEMADTEIDVTKFDTVKAELEGAAGVRDFMSVAAKYMDEQSIDKALFAEGASLVENRTKLTEQIAKAAAGKGKCPTCKGDTTCAKCDKAEKGDVDGDVAKVAGLEENITKLSAENDVLKADVVKLTGEIEALKKLPAPTKAVRLQVVTKSDDGGITGTESEQLSGPILKSDGSIDEEATCLAEIKKVHASAPIRFKR